MKCRDCQHVLFSVWWDDLSMRQVCSCELYLPVNSGDCTQYKKRETTRRARNYTEELGIFKDGWKL